MSERPIVEVDQCWRDNDPRERGLRIIRVVAVGLTHATVVTVRARTPRSIGQFTRIRLDRFRPRTNGYSLLSD